MGQDKGQVSTPVDDEQKSPAQLRQEIEEARRELGDTAAALAQKTDVKARAKERVDGVKQTLAEKKEELGSGHSDGSTGGGPAAKAGSAATQAKTKAKENPIVTAAVAAFAGGFIVGRIASR